MGRFFCVCPLVLRPVNYRQQSLSDGLQGVFINGIHIIFHRMPVWIEPGLAVPVEMYDVNGGDVYDLVDEDMIVGN